MVADIRLDQHLGVDEAVRADHEILKSVPLGALMKLVFSAFVVAGVYARSRRRVAERRVLEDYSTKVAVVASNAVRFAETSGDLSCVWSRMFQAFVPTLHMDPDPFQVGRRRVLEHS